MSAELIMAALIAFAVTAIGVRMAIPILHNLKFGQQVRDDGPKEHLKKQGTPTMGGIVFIPAVAIAVIACLPFGNATKSLPVLFMVAAFGLIGFLDDYLKIKKKKSQGLTSRQKLLLQLICTAVFCIYMMVFSGFGTQIRIPFTDFVWDMGWLYVPMVFLAVLGTDNGVNFTDGLDGLCSTVTIPVAIFFLLLSSQYGTGTQAICAAIIGCMMGFLLFNAYPAKVFMGDTGSLALGAFVASVALMCQQPIMILIVGLVYLVEVLSVMIQVVYFKSTGGKRLFRMAPIHHHFEMGGWSETRVVAVFAIVTSVLAMIAWLGV